MLVKYIGKLPAMKVEYNGKRYQFTRQAPIKDIPPVVYDYIKTGATHLAADIVPHIEQDKKAEDMSDALKKENSELKKANADLRRKVDKLEKAATAKVKAPIAKGKKK